MVTKVKSKQSTEQATQEGVSLRAIIERLIDREGSESAFERASGMQRVTARKLIGKQGGLLDLPKLQTFKNLSAYLQKLNDDGDPLIIDNQIIVLGVPELMELCEAEVQKSGERNQLHKLVDNLNDDQVGQVLGLVRMMVGGSSNGLGDLERLLNASTVGNLSTALQANLDIRFPNNNQVEQVRLFLADFSTTNESLEADLLMLLNFQQLPGEYYPLLFVLAGVLRKVTPKGLGQSFGGDIGGMLRFYGVIDYD